MSNDCEVSVPCTFIALEEKKKEKKKDETAVKKEIQQRKQLIHLHPTIAVVQTAMKDLAQQALSAPVFLLHSSLGLALLH